MRRFFESAMSARSTSMKRDFSMSDGYIGPVDKKSRVLSLPPTAPPLIADVKVEYVVSENVSG